MSEPGGRQSSPPLAPGFIIFLREKPHQIRKLGCDAAVL